MIKKTLKKLAVRELNILVKESGLEKTIAKSLCKEIERRTCIRYTTKKNGSIEDACTWLYLKNKEQYVRYTSRVDLTLYDSDRFKKNPYKYGAPPLMEGSEFIIRLDKYAFCKVSYDSTKKISDNDMRGKLSLVEDTRLTLLFTGKDVTKYYEEFKQEIASTHKSILKECDLISCSSYGTGHYSSNTMLARNADDIFLNEDIRNELFAYIDKWNKDIDFYYKRKMPHKLGILLSGVPGTGKSSIINTIGTIFDRRITYMEDLEKTTLLRTNTSRGIVAFEDIDKMLMNENGTINESAIRNLMQILDSPISNKDVIFIITSNDPEFIRRVAPALLRRGRIDKEFNIGLLEESECKKMAAYYDVDWELVKDFGFPAIPVEFRSKLLDIRYSNYEN